MNEPSKNCLKDKVILLTGASQGIGFATAKYLAQYGAHIVLLSRNVKQMEMLYDEIIAMSGPQPAIYPFNLLTAKPEDFEDIRRNIDKTFCKLDGLILNAGVLGTLSPIEYYGIIKWHEVLQINLNSQFLLTQACLPLMKRTKNSSIAITLNQQIIDKPRAYWSAYAVAQSGLKTFMHILSEETQSHTSIRVNAVDPGPTKTRLRHNAYPAEDTAQLNTPENAARLFLYLMSDQSQQVTGQIINSHLLQQATLEYS